MNIQPNRHKPLSLEGEWMNGAEVVEQNNRFIIIINNVK